MNKLMLLVLVVLVAAGVFWYLQPDTAQRWLQEGPLGSSGELTRVYKWRDGQGRWQITDEPPAPGVGAGQQFQRQRLDLVPRACSETPADTLPRRVFLVDFLR